MTKTTIPRALLGGTITLAAAMALALALPDKTTSLMQQLIRLPIILAVCVFALSFMNMRNTITMTKQSICDDIKTVGTLFKPTAIILAILFVMRFVIDAPSVISMAIRLPYYITYYVNVAVFEETLCRGAILTIMLTLARKFSWKPSIAVYLSSIIFTLPHFNATYLSNGMTIFFGIIQYVSVFIAGVCFATIYLKTKRLTTAMLAHWTTNMCMAIIVCPYIHNPQKAFSSTLDVLLNAAVDITIAVAMLSWLKKNRA